MKAAAYYFFRPPGLLKCDNLGPDTLPQSLPQVLLLTIKTRPSGAKGQKEGPEPSTKGPEPSTKGPEPSTKGPEISTKGPSLPAPFESRRYAMLCYVKNQTQKHASVKISQ